MVGAQTQLANVRTCLTKLTLMWNINAVIQAGPRASEAGQVCGVRCCIMPAWHVQLHFAALSAYKHGRAWSLSRTEPAQVAEVVGSAHAWVFSHPPCPRRRAIA